MLLNHIRSKPFRVSLVFSFIIALSGCGSTPPPPEPPIPASTPSQKKLQRLGWTIQAGAFRNVDNAVRFTGKLKQRGLEAYHFIDEDDLYKVRFGNYSRKADAQYRAGQLKSDGILEEFYIVNPESSAAALYADRDDQRLREEIVRTAARFTGTPYRWGGTSAKSGFDCSGLTQAVYQLNGLDLPRTSRQQWRTGKPIRRKELARGDLVFFATAGGRSVSHVGIYTGEGLFLHAPGKGKRIREASLDSKYFRKRYLGARTYL
jgi:cell wall-associated NlpC family hydrolase